MNDLSDVVERLARSVEALERRVSALEGRSQPELPVEVPPAAPQLRPARPAGAQAGIFSLLGKAMLGIAGAYLLRALAESSALPGGPVIAVAIAYALVWLIPASRAPERASVSSLVWASTSVLILVPMLWELTLRFRLLSDAVTAGVLAGFVIAALVLGWRRHFAALTWVVSGVASVAAVSFAIVTQDLLPFLLTLLLIAVATEVAVLRQRNAHVRAVVAAAADLGIFALIWVFSSAPAEHAEYRPVAAALLPAPGAILLFIYAASASTQTVLLRRGISFFEIVQTLVAFLLAIWGVLVFWSGPGAAVLGLVCLGASIAGYAVTFGWFDPAHAQRNYHVYATGSLALLLAGCFLSLPAPWLAVCLSGCAVAAAVLGASSGRLTLGFHGLACLVSAAVSSGLLVWAPHAMAGPFPGSPGWVRLTVFGSAVACYGAVVRSAGERWWNRTLSLLCAGTAAGSAAAFIVWALVRVTVPATPAASTLAVIRTLVLCAVSLGLAWAGSFWRKVELVWLAWSGLVLGALKLLVEDLRHGHLGFTAASIFLYAVTLLLVPRVVRLQHRAAGRN